MKPTLENVTCAVECATHFTSHQRARSLPTVRTFRPVLVDIGAAAVILQARPEAILAAVEEGSIFFVFDVRCHGARRCLRFWLGALLMQQDVSEEGALEMIVGRANCATLQRSTVADILLVDWCHVMNLGRAGMLRNVPGGVSRGSLIAFLDERRVA